MTRWLLRCTSCGRTWYLEVSFDLTKLSSGRLYHYCPYCRRNTFHEILGREEGEAEQPPHKPAEARGDRAGDEDQRGTEQR